VGPAVLSGFVAPGEPWELSEAFAAGEACEAVC
jgi:hypothetical protein